MGAALAHKSQTGLLHRLAIAKPTVMPKNFWFAAIRMILGAAVLAMVVATLMPDVRAFVRSSVLRDFRSVVSTVVGDLRGDGVPLTVVKVRTRNAMFLEIYDALPEGGQKLIEKIEMPNPRDGYFNFNGQATNLALDDIDGDGRAEILVPSFDTNLIGHLEIYRYDVAAQGFQRMMR